MAIMQCHPRVLFPIFFFFCCFPLIQPGDCCLNPLPAASRIIFSNGLLLHVSVFVMPQVDWCCPTMPWLFRHQQGKQHAVPGNFFPCFTAAWPCSSIFLITYPFLLPLFPGGGGMPGWWSAQGAKHFPSILNYFTTAGMMQYPWWHNDAGSWHTWQKTLNNHLSLCSIFPCYFYPSSHRSLATIVSHSVLFFPATFTHQATGCLPPPNKGRWCCNATGWQHQTGWIFLLALASFFELLLFTATFPGQVDCSLNTYPDNAATEFFLLIHF